MTAIPGVIAAGQQWMFLWQEAGNNGDGIVGTDDGGLLIAQNDKSVVLKLEPDGRTSAVHADTHTGGSVSINTKGEVFIVSRGLRTAILQLAPRRRVLANSFQGDPLDCAGTNPNDLTADEKTLYVTNGPALAAFDVQPDGALTNQRAFATLEGGGNGDGSTIDAEGRIYVTTNPGVQVIGPEGRYLGIIPTPRGTGLPTPRRSMRSR